MTQIERSRPLYHTLDPINDTIRLFLMIINSCICMHIMRMI